MGPEITEQLSFGSINLANTKVSRKIRGNNLTKKLLKQKSLKHLAR